jgi:hypothetical protein
MDFFTFLASLPLPALLASIGCLFLLLLTFILLVAFVPSAAKRLYSVIDTILRSHYTKRKYEITIVFRDFHDDDQKKVSK